MTTKKNRRQFTAEFKSQVALEALQGKEAQSELSKRYEVHPNLIGEWKKALIDNCHRIFEDPHPERDACDKKIDALTKENDILTQDVNFLKKKLSPYL